MGFTIDIDTGGTFTDGIVVNGQDARTVKVPTTPHDLTLCFAECIRAGAEAFGRPVEDLLAGTEIVRFCNTIGTNTIIQRDGAKIGLLVTAGHEAQAPTERGDAPAPLVWPDMVRGIDECIDADGRAQRAPEAGAVLMAAQALIDQGARALVVALANSERNPAHEREVRRIVKHEYPRDYLGSVPVFLASDISTRSGYRERINTAAVNAYIHARLARLLYKSGEDLRRLDYRGTLFIGHNNGAAARVARTRAINTYNSGPAAGLLGAREIGRLYGSRDVISTDMGGTSFDIGLVRDGEAALALAPDVEGFACNLPMMSIRALGAGGGSLARVEDGRVVVGPRSAGAFPGPACFDRGGTEPTVTDANLVLGLLDPDYFLGGGMKLRVDLARRAIEARISTPLGIPVEAAARAIRDEVDRMMGEGVAQAARGLDAGGVTIVAYGGAGALHACAVAARAGLGRIVMTPFAAVFSAYSSSLLDVGHLYYRRVDLAIEALADAAALADAEREMTREARRDMRGEGFADDRVRHALQLYVTTRDGTEFVVHAPVGFHLDAGGATAVRAAIAAECRRLALDPEGAVLSSIALMASAATPHIAPVAGDATPAPATPKGTRAAWLDAQGAKSLPVYDFGALDRGASVAGPALIESAQTTLLVDAGWRLDIDRYQHAVLTRVNP